LPPRAPNGIRFSDRIRAYPVALELKDSLGWGPKRIGQHLGLPPSTICNWIHGRFLPYGSCVLPRLEPSPPLSYLIGALRGDGDLIRSRAYHYELRLRVRDLDFAQHFSSCLTAITGRPRSPKLDTRGFFVVRAWSRLLFEYLSEWKSVLGTVDRYPAEFIQGFADAEGSPAVSANLDRPLTLHVVLVNTNRPLLAYIGELLKVKFDIESKIFVDHRKHLMWGKAPCYYLRIRRRTDVERFASGIGFSIKRKQEKLLTALSLIQTYGSSAAGLEWRKIFSKRGRIWVRMTDPDHCSRRSSIGSGTGAPGGI